MSEENTAKLKQTKKKLRGGNNVVINPKKEDLMQEKLNPAVAGVREGVSRLRMEALDNLKAKRNEQPIAEGTHNAGPSQPEEVEESVESKSDDESVVEKQKELAERLKLRMMQQMTEDHDRKYRGVFIDIADPKN